MEEDRSGIVGLLVFAVFMVGLEVVGLLTLRGALRNYGKDRLALIVLSCFLFSYMLIGLVYAALNLSPKRSRPYLESGDGPIAAAVGLVVIALTFVGTCCL
jgi:hypothetical protein